MKHVIIYTIRMTYLEKMSKETEREEIKDETHELEETEREEIKDETHELEDEEKDESEDEDVEEED
jgi:hypothetical protein